MVNGRRLKSLGSIPNSAWKKNYYYFPTIIMLLYFYFVTGHNYIALVGLELSM